MRKAKARKPLLARRKKRRLLTRFKAKAGRRSGKKWRRRSRLGLAKLRSRRRAGRARRFRRKPQPAPKPIILVPQVSLPAVEVWGRTNEDETAKQTTISVIIPTYNAGTDFERLLLMLRKQRSFKAIQIMVVDSGSMDETLEIAGRHDAEIVQIPPEHFSHSHARNVGADHAYGDYLLFLTQDALPPNDSWLLQQYLAARNYGVAAVSCREFLKADADLYYRVICSSHYRYLGLAESDKIMAMPGSHDYHSIRTNSQLQSISCLIRTDIFHSYKFRLNFAEDLDLGYRLIQDGHRLALLNNAKIIHSHNRPAGYYLKRSFVDLTTLKQIFGQYPYRDPGRSNLAKDIVYSYAALNDLVNRVLNHAGLPCAIGELHQMAADALNQAIYHHSISYIDWHKNDYDDYQLHSLLSGFVFSAPDDFGYYPDYGVLLFELQGYFANMIDYLARSYDRIEAGLMEEIKISLFKAMATYVGTYLATSRTEPPDEGNDAFSYFEKQLTIGV